MENESVVTRDLNEDRCDYNGTAQWSFGGDGAVLQPHYMNLYMC